MSNDPLSAQPRSFDYLARHASGGSLASIRYYLSIVPQKLEDPSAGRTPLLWAISKGREEAMNLFLQAGADITKKTADGDPALTCAVWSGDVKMVQLMLDKGIDPSEKSIHGKTALDWAGELGKTDIIELLQEPTRVAQQQRISTVMTRNQKILTARAWQKVSIRP